MCDVWAGRGRTEIEKGSEAAYGRPSLELVLPRAERGNETQGMIADGASEGAMAS